MNVQEVKNRKRLLEQSIAYQVSEFMKETETIVDYINLNFTDISTFNETKKVLNSVNLEVSIT